MRGNYNELRTYVSILALFLVPVLFASTVSADRFTSPSYTIDASSTGSSISGPQSSTNYSLVSSGGESVIGNATGGSYKLGEGYVAQLEQSMQLSLAPSTLGIGTVTPGTSATINFTASILTDAPGYTLSVSQNNNLTSGGNTIPAVSGSITSPVSWTEGTTKGLGFSLVSTNATAIPGKWSSGSAYAAFPSSSTAFYTRTGYTAGSTDTLDMRVRLDVANSQPTGSYTNTVTWIGTTTP
jgi:hypothetical protein